MNEALRRSAAHVFVENLSDPVLSEVDQHHLTKVLRITPKQSVSVCDGQGQWRLATYTNGKLTELGEITTTNKATRSRLAFVPVKGDRAELIVQKATEIGIDEIVVVAPTSRSVVRWDSTKIDKELGRLRRISREASMQSRRLTLPSVRGLVELSVLAEEGFAVADPDGAIRTGEDALVIGPEGGLTEEELEMFSQRVSLGDTVLRAETAAIVATVAMCQPRMVQG